MSFTLLGILNAQVAAAGGGLQYLALMQNTTGNYPSRGWSQLDADGNTIWIMNGGPSGSIIVAKFDTEGTIQWAKYWDETSGGNVTYNGFGIDSSGDVYVLAFNTQQNDQWHIKINGSTGALTTSRNRYQYYTGHTNIVFDNAGNGYYAQVIYDSGSSYRANATIVKFDTSNFSVTGTTMLAYNFGNASASDLGIAIDSNNNLIILGRAITDGSSFNKNVFLLKVDSSLTTVFVKTSTETNIDHRASFVGVDSSDNIYVTHRVSPSYDQIWIHKFNSSGTAQWNKSLSRATESISNYPASTPVDADGAVYATTYRYDNQIYPNYVVKIDTDGTQAWQRKFVETANESNEGLFQPRLSINDKNRTDNTFCLSFNHESNLNHQYLWALPNDGSLTDTYTIGPATVVYSASTDLTFGTPSITWTTGGTTRSSGSFTNTVDLFYPNNYTAYSLSFQTI